MITTIALNPYSKRLAAKILNAAADLNFSYRAEHITGIRLIDGVAQVKVTIGDRTCVLPFNPEEFKAMAISFRLEVLAALSTEQAWARHTAKIPAAIRRLASLVRLSLVRSSTQAKEA
jgi:hypothetical protein